MAKFLLSTSLLQPQGLGRSPLASGVVVSAQRGAEVVVVMALLEYIIPMGYDFTLVVFSVPIVLFIGI